MISNLTSKTIDKSIELKPAMDYDFLRSKGIEYITELAGRIWTDHNSHDPGITILEILSYALTDLSYRTNFPIEDLLALDSTELDDWAAKYPQPHLKASYSDLAKIGMFEAHEVLPTHPWTVFDYRKLLLKIKGVRNAWLLPHCDSAETPIYADCENSRIVFSEFEYVVKSGALTDHVLLIRFPEGSKIFENRWNARITSIERVNRKGRHINVKLRITVNGKNSVYGLTLILDRDVARIDPRSIENLFRADSVETLWSDLRKHHENIIDKTYKELYLNGLYNVLLELDVDPEMGPLTERALIYKVPSGRLKGTVVRFDLGIDLPQFPELDSFDSLDSIIKPFDDKEEWEIDLHLTINGKSYEVKDAKLYLLRSISIDYKNSADSRPDQTSIIEEAFGNTALNPESSIFNVYWKKQHTINKTLKSVQCVLDAHRNLCEDFYKIDLVKPYHVGVCMDVETRSDADLELLMAKIALKIEEYFNPQINRYTLNEMVEEHYKADEIFNGPYVDFDFKCIHDPEKPVFTKAGFIKDEELEQSELRSTILGSDLINSLKDFEEIIAIKNLILRPLNALGQPTGDNEKWCLPIPDGHQPVFDVSLSKVTFFKNDIPYSAKLTETEDSLKFLRAQARKMAYIPLDQSFVIPNGHVRNLDKYYPIQHDLPDIYGTSEMRLPTNTASERLNQTRNLKAYLLFYEQILADYLQQLYNAKWLLSPEPMTQSYFSKYLQTEEISPLLADTFEEEYYFKPPDPAPPYLSDNEIRKRLYERDQEFVERRNAMLDHLLGRFAESFSEYTLMLYTIKGERTRSGVELIEDKSKFLEAYPKLSRERGKAFNYRPADASLIWDSSNISGFENRLGLLMGIENTNRRFLHCDSVESAMLKAQKVPSQDKFFISCRNYENIQLFRSAEEFDSRAEADLLIEKIKKGIRYPSSFELMADRRISFSYDGEQIISFKQLDSEAEYETFLENLFSSYDYMLRNGEACGDESKEGMYLVEHILLRPLSPDFSDTLLDVCLPIDCGSCCLDDPYSFRVSIILPYWPGRFDDQDFRSFFEQSVRRELPAHIMPKICWISNDQMESFGNRYKEWLEAKAGDIPAEDYNRILANLLDELKTLRNVYPAATLHDCEEDGADNPVRLGHTSLGIY